jgi:hypothetical protein
MSVIQTDIFGESYEIVAGKAYKISKEEITQQPKYQPQHFAGGKCRPCNYAENSDGMYGAHCGECECCSEKLNN